MLLKASEAIPTDLLTSTEVHKHKNVVFKLT